MSHALPDRLVDYLQTVEPGSIAAILPRDLHPPGLVPSKTARVTDPASGTLYQALFNQQSISSICIDLNSSIVEKQIGRFAEFGILAREAHWLTVLAAADIAPPLLASAGSALRLGYVGEPVRRYNLPDDWPAQAERILQALATADCAHNDIKCDNLTVRDGRLYLIDFGWSTRSADPIPSDWPQGIGRQHRLGIHRFDDRAAIYAALASAERDEVDRSIVMATPGT
jgi:hypothetical protein